MNSVYARIQKDIKEVNNNIDIDTPPIFCKVVGDNLDNLDCLIIGPPDTPYEFGFFRFEMKFGSNYPDKPPKVLITTTDGNRVRLNPNLYSQGKVCLSILGTWTGESADEWRSTYSVNYILRAIQSLIMTSKPYHNEPGYEEMKSEYSKPEEVQLYSSKIKHEVLRVAVCSVLEECFHSKKENLFKDIIKHYFLFYYDSYVRRALEDMKLDGNEFAIMPFEYPENGAYGKYNYQNIVSRLSEIKGKLEKETELWKKQGHEWTKSESGWYYFKMLEENEKIKKGDPRLEVGISTGPVSEDNLFYWNASIFGPEGTMWEGGIFHLELVFHNSDAPPRVRFLTEMWHPHITKDGIPFFRVLPGIKEPVIPILLEIYKLLKNEPNSSSATWINREAAEQYFSKNEEMKKEYKKRVTDRKSVV